MGETEEKHVNWKREYRGYPAWITGNLTNINNDRITGTGGTLKRLRTYAIGASEKKGDGRRGQKKVLEEIMAKNFSNLAKDINL